MKNLFITYSIAICMLLGFQSCEDGMNTVNPNIITTEVYWSTLEETGASLNAVYNSIYNHYLLTIEASTISADMGYPGYGRNGAPTNYVLAMYYNQAFNNSSIGVFSKWSALYLGIFRANQTIEGLNSLVADGIATPDNEEWISQMAQARFFRGLFHFYLHSVYNQGNIIYYDFVPKVQADYYQKLTPAAEVQSKFREDIKYAYENLPLNYTSPNDLGRVTKGAAATILGISHVYANEFAEAEPYFDEVINDFGYELAAPNMLFTKDGELNSESIFEICYSAGLRPELDEYDESSLTNRLGATSTTQSFTLPAWLLHAYQTEAIDTLNVINHVSDGLTVVLDSTNKKVVQARKYRVLSRRASAMIASAMDEDTPYYLNPSTSEKLKINPKQSVGYYRKYTNWDVVTDEKLAGEGIRKSGKNVTINRLSEVYLLKAECLLERDDVQGALDCINAIRRRWGLVLRGPSNGVKGRTYDEVNYTSDSLMYVLRHVEKPLELSAEGHFIRNIDLRRWGMAKDNFSELAKVEYALTTYNYVKIADKESQKVTSALRAHILPLSLTDSTFEFKAVDNLFDYYKPAAENYDNAGAGYWPIPLLEEQNNPNLYK